MLPEKIPNTVLYRLQAKNFPVNRWFGLYLEEPMEDLNYQDGRFTGEVINGKLYFMFGSWIEGQFFEPDEWIVITWFDWQHDYTV